MREPIAATAGAFSAGPGSVDSCAQRRPSNRSTVRFFGPPSTWIAPAATTTPCADLALGNGGAFVQPAAAKTEVTTRTEINRMGGEPTTPAPVEEFEFINR